MAKGKQNESTEMTVPKNEIAPLPSYLQGGDSASVDMLKQFVRPPRLKVIQSTATSQFKEKFDEGDTAMVPHMELLCPKGTSFYFTPIFFFPQWCEVGPMALKGVEPMIRASTLKEDSALARKCKDPLRRKEFHPKYPDSEKHQVTFVEYLNFIVVIQGDSPLSGVPVIMSFSKGEHKQGTKLSNLVSLRKCKYLYGNVFEAKVPDVPRKNNDGEWYGWDVNNPAEDAPVSRWVPEDQFNVFKGIYEDLAAKHAADLLVVDHGDEDLQGSPSGEGKSDTELQAEKAF